MALGVPSKQAVPWLCAAVVLLGAPRQRCLGLLSSWEPPPSPHHAHLQPCPQPAAHSGSHQTQPHLHPCSEQTNAAPGSAGPRDGGSQRGLRAPHPSHGSTLIHPHTDTHRDLLCLRELHLECTDRSFQLVDLIREPILHLWRDGDDHGSEQGWHWAQGCFGKATVLPPPPSDPYGVIFRVDPHLTQEPSCSAPRSLPTRPIPDPGTAPHWADSCGSPGGCEPPSGPAFSFADLPPGVGCPLPSQQFPPTSKAKKDTNPEGQPQRPGGDRLQNSPRSL